MTFMMTSRSTIIWQILSQRNQRPSWNAEVTGSNVHSRSTLSGLSAAGAILSFRIGPRFGHFYRSKADRQSGFISGIAARASGCRVQAPGPKTRRDVGKRQRRTFATESKLLEATGLMSY